MPLPAVANVARQLLGMLGTQQMRVEGHGTAPRPDSPGLLAWAREFLPRHVRSAPSLMHVWVAEQLDGWHRAEGTKLNVLGPRGSAKSTLVTLAYVLRSAVEGREPYIWIVSDTQSQACTHLANLRAELEHNRRLRKVYRWSTRPGAIWRSDVLSLSNGVTIEAYGTGQKVRGRRRMHHRPTLIVCDDLQNDQQVATPEGRERARQWFHGTLLKAGARQTNVVNLATALHREALALELHENPGWTSRIFRAIENWPDDMKLWEAWEALYTDPAREDRREAARAFFEEHRPRMEAGATVLWPEVDDLYRLMQMRVESGRAAFEREKQNSPLNPELCEWPASYFDAGIWFDDWPQDLLVKTIALDPSKGRDGEKGDYSAYVVLGIDRQGTLYVEADLDRRPTPQMVDDGVELCRRFLPDAFGVESNQFQELLGDDFAEAFGRQGLPLRIWTLDNRVNKRVRIRRLGPYLSRRAARFKSHSPATALLVNQLRDFPLGAHDDGPDAFEMALRLAGELLAGRGSPDGLGDRLI
ncbi:MAG: hypothetical protein KF708_02590 [Pirellulales bacterium]|nr:hypothetical protein [Pirellulales bacterium]